MVRNKQNDPEYWRGQHRYWRRQMWIWAFIALLFAVSAALQIAGLMMHG